MRYLRGLFSWLKPDFLPIGFAILTVVLGIIGWFEKDFDGSFHSAVIIAFRALGNFTPSYKNLGEGNALTDLAALCGMLTIYASALVIASKALREWRRKMVARWLSRDHVVVVGDSELARRVQSSWEAKRLWPLQIISADTSRSLDWKIRQVRHSLDEGLEKAFSLTRARRVFIDLGDDTQTFDLALKLLVAVSRRSGRQSTLGEDREWIVVARNTELADRFFSRVDDLRLVRGATDYFPIVHHLDPARLAARHVLSSHPLFLQAQDMRQRAIHVIIVGSGAVSRHLIESICLMSPTVEFGSPFLTVVSDQMKWDRDRFFLGRSPLATAIDICFLDTEALSGFVDSDSGSTAMLRSRDEVSPITAVFVAAENNDESLDKMTLVERFCRQTGRFDFPIHCFSEHPEDSYLICSKQDAGAPGAVSIFGLSDAALNAQIADSGKRDKLAKALHTFYSTHVDATQKQAESWYRLPESLRRANRNAADHWRAKMYSFGFDVRQIAPGTLPCLSLKDAASLIRSAEIGAPATEHAMFRAIARIEHERWVIERLIDGWEYGAFKDDRRKTHPSLLPWEQLGDCLSTEVEKCFDQVKALIDCLCRLGDPDVTLSRKL